MTVSCHKLLLIVSYVISTKCQWIAPSSPLVPRATNGLAVGSYEGSIFLLGGADNINDQMFIYSIDDDNFTTVPMADWYIGSSSQHYTALENLLYLMDGDTLHIYNMETNAFTRDWKALSETTEDEACLTSTSEYLFVISGLTPSPEWNYKTTVQVLVLSTMEWMTSVPTINEARKSGTCIADALTNKVYAIGGMNDVGGSIRYLSSIEFIYIDNIASNSWTFIDNMSMPLVGQRAVIHETKIFIIGGTYPSLTNGFQSLVHTIDTMTDEVSVFSEQLVYPVAYTAAIVVNNIIYAFCGNNDDSLNKWMYYMLPTISTTGSPITTTTTTTTIITSSTIPTTSPITTLPTTAATTTTETTIWDPSRYCHDIIVEIINLDGISAYDFMTNEQLKYLMINITTNAIAASAADYGIADDLFYVEYKLTADRINITQSVCVEKQNILNVLNVVVVEKANVIAGYIRNQIIEYFKEIDEVSTDDMDVKIYWGSYPTKQEVIIMEIPSLYVTLIILALFFIFALISLCDAKLFRTNDYFSAISIIIASFEVSDTILDLFFAVFLLLKYLINKDIEILIASIAGFVFIIIPITFSIFQLMQKAKKSWFIDDDLSNWLKEYGKILFFFSILTGSAYTAVQLVNCGAFKLDIFNMGLNKQERIKFNAKRAIGVVCLENIPQMIIQIWYLARFGADFLPILSIIFSIVSIILTVLTIYTQKAIIKNQEVIKIEFDIVGDEIKPKLSTKTQGIKSEIGVLLGIKHNLMEIQQPKVVPKGLRFEICLFINDVHYRNLNCKTTITTAIRNMELVNIIKNEWKLETSPMIENVKFIPAEDDTEEIGYHTTNQYTSVNTDDDETTMHVQVI